MSDLLSAVVHVVFEAPCAACGGIAFRTEIGPDGVAEVECLDCGAWELIGRA